MSDKEFVLSIYPDAFVEQDTVSKYYGYHLLWESENRGKLLAYFNDKEFIWTYAKEIIKNQMLSRLAQ